MYLGAVLCALICVAMVYEITVTKDTSNEWIIFITVIMGFCLFGFGFLYESRNRVDKFETDEQSVQKSA